MKPAPSGVEGKTGRGARRPPPRRVIPSRFESPGAITAALGGGAPGAPPAAGRGSQLVRVPPLPGRGAAVGGRAVRIPRTLCPVERFPPSGPDRRAPVPDREESACRSESNRRTSEGRRNCCPSQRPKVPSAARSEAGRPAGRAGAVAASAIFTRTRSDTRTAPARVTRRTAEVTAPAGTPQGEDRQGAEASRFQTGEAAGGEGPHRRVEGSSARPGPPGGAERGGIDDPSPEALKTTKPGGGQVSPGTSAETGSIGRGVGIGAPEWPWGPPAWAPQAWDPSSAPAPTWAPDPRWAPAPWWGVGVGETRQRATRSADTPPAEVKTPPRRGFPRDPQGQDHGRPCRPQGAQAAPSQRATSHQRRRKRCGTGPPRRGSPPRPPGRRTF